MSGHTVGHFGQTGGTILDFNTYKFGIMNIEHNYVEPRRSNIRKFLEKKGYKFYKEKDVDDFYIS